MPLPLIPIAAALLAGGSIAKGVGARREAGAHRRQSDAEHARLEAADKRRAAGRAALARGILNSIGYGGSMTDEQILAMFSGARRRDIITTPSIWSGIGQGASRAGELMLLGSAGGGGGGGGASAAAATPASPSGMTAYEEYLRMIRGGTGGPPP